VQEIIDAIEAGFDARGDLSNRESNAGLQAAVNEALALLDSGKARVA
jgi:hypothetical protein